MIDPRTASVAICYRDMMGSSLFAEAGPRVRPAGVRFLALACLALGIYIGINGLLVMVGTVSFASGAYLLGGMETMGSTIYFLVALVLTGLGFALFRGWRWSRRVAIMAAALLFAGAVMPVSSAVIDARILSIVTQGAKIIAAIVVIRYLLQPEVVDYFSAKNG